MKIMKVAWRILLAAGVLAAGGASRAKAMSADDLDRRLEELWAKDAPPPAGPAEPWELLRRLSLDLRGRIPESSLLDQTLKNPESVDLEAFIVSSLEPDVFSAHWARVVRSWLTGREYSFQALVNRTLDLWIEDRLRHGIGMDAMARELIAAEGTELDNPAVGYLLQFKESQENMAGHVARTWLGSQIQCAQCHDHPFERWKQEDFRGFSAFFDRLGLQHLPRGIVEPLLRGESMTPSQYMDQMPDYVRNGFKPDSPQAVKVQATIDYIRKLRDDRRKDPASFRGSTSLEEAYERMKVPLETRRSMKPKTLAFLQDQEKKPGGTMNTMAMVAGVKPPEPVEPRFLDGTRPAPAAAGETRRQQLARWITSPENPTFAKVIVNRVWKQLMGRGLVEPVDNMVNPDDARFAPVLADLAAAFRADGYRLEPLIARIVATRAYRRRCLGEAPGKGGEHRFEHALARPLMPEVTIGAVLDVISSTGILRLPEKNQVEDMRSSMEDEFVETFGPGSDPSSSSLSLAVHDALFLINGPTVNGPVTVVTAGLERLIGDGGVAARLARLFARVLDRAPSAAELAAFQAHVEAAATRSPDPVAERGSGRAASRSGWFDLLQERVGAGDAGMEAGAKPALSSLEQMAWQDVLWAMMTSVEFLTNH